MSVVKAFNGLNGRVVTRPELEEIIAQAKKEEQPNVAFRLSSILQKYEDESFEINVSQPEIECLPQSLIDYIDQGDDLPDDSGGLGRAITGNDIYDMVTNQIIHNIENSGHLPWYHGRDKKGKDTYIDIPLPINYATKKYYRGINALILSFYPKKNTKIPFVVDTEPITDGRLCWMTPKQIKERGGTIRKGAIAAKVVYYNWIYKHDKEVIDEEEYMELRKKYKCNTKNASKACKNIYKIPFLRYYNVINERDIEGIDFKSFWEKINKTSAKKKIESEAEKIEAAELVIANMPQRPPMIERNLTGNESPYYSPGTDKVVMPQKEQYSNVALWYGTAFHELIHATGHASRIGRPGITDFKGFGSPSYAFEEIIAELGSAFLNAESGIFFHTLKKNTAYIKGWKQKVIATLKDDNKAILKAAGAAQKAADFILNRDANGVPAFYKDLLKKEIKVKPTPPAKPKKKEGEKSKRSIKKGTAKKAEKKTGNEAKKSEPKEGVNIKAGLNGISNDLFEGLKAPTASNPDTINFNKEILKAKRNGIKPRQIFFLGHTKGVLKTYVGDRKMYVSGANIQKSMTKDKAHSVKWETLINLPDNLNNPIAIFKSKTAGNVIVTALFDEKDKAYMVAVHANRHFRIKEIKSIYSKDDKRIYSKWENEGLLIWKDEKSDLLERVFPALIAGASKKPHHKTTKKTQPTKKRGLKSPVIPLLPDNQVQVQEETPVTPRPKSFLNAGHGENNFFDVPGETGKFLQVVERKPVGSVVITIDGEQGAGKTTMLYKFMNDFAGGGNKCLFLSAEEHPESFLAIEKKNKYISTGSQANIDIVDEVTNTRELYDLIENYEVIFIDSWQKLLRMIGNIRLDEDLRKKFNGKVFVIIFQQTTTGRTKGGAEVVFDGDIIIKMKKEAVFTENFAYFDKHRYTRVPLETIRYNIFTGKVYDPTADNYNAETEDEEFIIEEICS